MVQRISVFVKQRFRDHIRSAPIVLQDVHRDSLKNSVEMDTWFKGYRNGDLIHWLNSRLNITDFEVSIQFSKPVSGIKSLTILPVPRQTLDVFSLCSCVCKVCILVFCMQSNDSLSPTWTFQGQLATWTSYISLAHIDISDPHSCKSM